LGNNHIENFGSDGMRSTQTFLAEAGVGYFGGVQGNELVLRAELHGIKLSFVSYNQFGGAAPETVAQKIFSERAAGRIVVVFAHWGDEYNRGVTDEQQTAAHLFVDSGAEVVLGSHPHVIEPSEKYKGKKIYYSLGNFIFDQYFDDFVRHGLMVRITFTSEGAVAFADNTVVLGSDRKTCPLASVETII
jgi:poly-gamma-glutamate synthesis protein (capsule biosynthesis protein)